MRFAPVAGRCLGGRGVRFAPESRKSRWAAEACVSPIATTAGECANIHRPRCVFLAPGYDPLAGCGHGFRCTDFVAFDRRQPFSRADARAAGIALRELLGPRYHKVLYDRYVLSSVPITVALRGEAALAISPAGSYLSHHTAAELWGGVVPRSSDVHVTVPEASSVRSRRQGIKGHVAAGRPDPVWLRRLPVSGPTQTFLDLAGAGLDLIDLVVLGDSLVKRCRLLPKI